MNKKAMMFVHCLVCGVELLILAFIVLFPVFKDRELRRKNLCDSDAEFRFRFGAQVDGDCGIGELKQLSVFYFTNDDQVHNSKKAIRFKPTGQSNDGWFTGVFPGGVTNFKIDFLVDRKKSSASNPPHIEEFLIDGKPIDHQWFKRGYWYASDTPVIWYEPRPLLNGWFREYITYVLLLWIMTLAFFLVIIRAYNKRMR